MAVLGDFCFPAGKPDRELILAEQFRKETGFMIMVPQNAEWAALISERAEQKCEAAAFMNMRAELLHIHNIFEKNILCDQ